jgi:hypothetical protein
LVFVRPRTKLIGVLSIATAVLVLGAAPLALRSGAEPGARAQHTATGVPVDPAVEALWLASDGPVAAKHVSRAWLWGPVALASGVEHTADSPRGLRSMVYYDKARLDILDPDRDPADTWYVSGALLVAQLLSGRIPFADEVVVERPLSDIAVAGDLDQPSPLTYATFGAVASIAGEPLRGGEPGAAPEPRVGMPVQALLAADGSVSPEAMTESAVLVAGYDEHTGHNVATPFAEWAASQPYDPLWLAGRPLTEPYWLDTQVDGAAKRVLVQAFERRILTYAPDQPRGWRVESTNVGDHYRLWRGLDQPDDAGLISLASFEPFGEELVAAAVAQAVDPFLLAAVAEAASAGNPAATAANGGAGLLAVRPEVGEALGGGDLHDPALNAAYGAAELRRWAGAAGDTRAALAGYYSNGSTGPDDPALAGLLDATLATEAELRATHPMTFDVAPEPSEPGSLLGTGRAAYYGQQYDVAWWERTMRLYASWGNIMPGWQYDPNGYYCVRPGYQVGQRLLLRANGVEIACTVGDTVAQQDIANWQSRWVIELNWPAFTALGLDRENRVEVFHLGAVG